MGSLDTTCIVTDIISLLVVSVLSIGFPFISSKKLDLKRGIKWINVFGAGILMGVCFFHYIPHVQDNFKNIMPVDPHAGHNHGKLDGEEKVDRMEELKSHVIEISMYICLVSGMMLILLIENAVLSFVAIPKDAGLGQTLCTDHKCPSANGSKIYEAPAYPMEGKECQDSEKGHMLKPSEKKLPFSCDDCCSTNSCEQSESTNKTDNSNENVHKIKSLTTVSSLRAITLIGALSVHTFFEGIALAFQSTSWSSTLVMLISILAHKIPVGMTLSFKVKSSNLPMKTGIAMLITWAVFAPIGTLVGVATCKFNLLSNVVVICLDGISCGTFLYVLFFEIAPHEFMHTQDANMKTRFYKALTLLAGVMVMFIMIINLPCQHDVTSPCATPELPEHLKDINYVEKNLKDYESTLNMTDYADYYAR